MTGGAALLPGLVLIISANFQAHSASRTLTNLSQCLPAHKASDHGLLRAVHGEDQTGVPLDQAPAEVQRLEDGGLHTGKLGCAVDYFLHKGQVGICCKSNGAMSLAVSMY